MTDYFIAGAIERPGRVQRYVMKLFGPQAFTSKGTIKDDYLTKAQKYAKDNKETSLERAIILARRLKGFAKEKKMRY